jgi:hypothetical protein
MKNKASEKFLSPVLKGQQQVYNQSMQNEWEDRMLHRSSDLWHDSAAI